MKTNLNIHIYETSRPGPTQQSNTQSNSWVCLTIPWHLVFTGLNRLEINIG